MQFLTILCFHFRKNFVFGEILNVDDIAFSPTTPDGDAFAIKYCGRRDYLSYLGTYDK